MASAMKSTLADQAEILAGLTGLNAQVAELATRIDEITPGDDRELAVYQPSASPRFWKLDGPGRQDAISKLRAWVEQIYRPGYGHLSAALGDCWEQHPLCLYILDWLSELWSVLYLQPRRTTGTLAGQAEWQTRLLTAAAEQLARETTRCQHGSPQRPSPDGNRPWPPRLSDGRPDSGALRAAATRDPRSRR